MFSRLWQFLLGAVACTLLEKNSESQNSNELENSVSSNSELPEIARQDLIYENGYMIVPQEFDSVDFKDKYENVNRQLPQNNEANLR